jgi:hypothetical protein
MLTKGSTAMAGRLLAVRLHTHRANEAEAFARDGADQLLVLATVTDRVSRGVDAAGERRI